MDNVVGLPERPEPPDHLVDAEAQVWREVVATRPADWFMRDSQPVLAAYCQAVVMHRDLACMWHLAMCTSKPSDAGERLTAVLSLKDLNGMITKSANLAAALATKLRLTQQSRYTPQSASTASKKADGRKLWQKS